MDDGSKYEDGGLYIILTTIATSTWHWGIYLSVSGNYGMVYHATDTTNIWVKEDHMTENIAMSRSIICALHFGHDIQGDRSQAAHDIMAAVPVIVDGAVDPKWGRKFNCIVWILEALDRLRKAGLIPDQPPLEVEDEVRNLVTSCGSLGERRIQQTSALSAEMKG